MAARLENMVEEVAALVKLTREDGVAVELDHFLKPGWAWSFEGERFRVTGPSAGWLPEVRRLKAALA